MEVKKRNITLDILKCVAIYSVILLHSIQGLGAGMTVLDHPLGKLISMVSMPLFIFITGYFSGSIYTRKLNQLIEIKYITLLRPMLLFSIVMFALKITIGRLNVNSLVELGKITILMLLNSYWFVYVVIYCTFYSWIVRKLAGQLKLSELLFDIISLVVLILVPYCLNIPHLASFKAMYPFFIIGTIFKKESVFKKPVSTFLLLLCSVLFIVSFLLYDGEKFFYYFQLTTYPEVIFNYILMLFAGTSGIILIYCVISKFKQWMTPNALKLFGSVGQYTLAIYLSQGIIMYCLDCYAINISDVFLETVLSVLLSLMVMSGLSYTILKIRKNYILSKYLLGKN